MSTHVMMRGVHTLDRDRAPSGRDAPRRAVSRRLLRAAGRRPDPDEISIESMLSGLGDRSFGWCMLLFALVNMVPMPIGSTLVTAVPLILLTAQLALGYRHLHVPRFIAHRRVSRRRFQAIVLWLKPLFAPIEKVLRPRMVWLFSARNE